MMTHYGSEASDASDALDAGDASNKRVGNGRDARARDGGDENARGHDRASRERKRSLVRAGLPSTVRERERSSQRGPRH